MCLWVLKGSGKVVPTRSVRPLTPSERSGDKKRNFFDELIARRHGTSINPPKPMKGEPDTKEPEDADGNEMCQRVLKDHGTYSDNPIMNSILFERQCWMAC
jgi:hypothetical protein